MTETLDEILADKMIAFVNCQSYVRHRDIYWLKQQGARIKNEFLKLKINDYRIEDYSNKAKVMRLKLRDIIFGKEFLSQMSRFLPMDLQEKTLLKEKFLTILERETAETLLVKI